MKLRNKRTGEIEAVQHNVALLHFSSGRTSAYHSIADLNDEWEDYTPPEPRLEDEKVRKVLRAWAEVNGIEEVRVIQNKEITSFCDEHINLIFYGNLTGLIDGADYTITELCGEEE